MRSDSLRTIGFVLVGIHCNSSAGHGADTVTCGSAAQIGVGHGKSYIGRSH